MQSSIRLHNNRARLLGMVLAFAGILAASASAEKPDCKTPLNIYAPVYKNTQIVGYEEGTSGCPVLIYANGQLVVSGHDKVSIVGWGKVRLTRPLKEGEVITAKQDPAGFSTWHPLTVGRVPSENLIGGEKFKPPSITPPMVECQFGFNVHDLVPGARAGYNLKPLPTGPPRTTEGSDWTPYASSLPLLRVDGLLQKGDELQAWQDMDAPWPQKSAFSPVTIVGPLPPELPPPFLPDLVNAGTTDIAPAAIWGDTTLVAENLWVGAEVIIHEYDPASAQKGERIGGGIATAPAQVFPLAKPLSKETMYRATQSLCKLERTGNPLIPHDEMPSPIICEPLCEGDTEIGLGVTHPFATVWVRVTSGGQQTISTATAPGPNTAVPLNGGVGLKQGDTVAAWQSNQYLASQPTFKEAFVLKLSREVCLGWRKETGISCSRRPWPDSTGDGHIGHIVPPPTCANAGQTCAVHPPECAGRGPNWTVTGRIVCVGGQAQCKATAGQDYCNSCGGACGECYGYSCTSNAQCIPGSTCKATEGGGGYKGCYPMGLGCTPVQQMCWTKNEVGIPQIGCAEGQK